MLVTSVRRRGAKLLAGLLLIVVGCAGPRLGSNELIDVPFTSNVPGTEFRMRVQKHDQAPDQGWQVFGTGKEAVAKMFEQERYEVEARAPGYREAKKFSYTEPPRYRPAFEWLSSERDLATGGGGPPAGSGTPPPTGGAPTPGAGALPPATGQKHVLIVGISEYQDGNFDTIVKARKDAETLAAWFRSPAGGNLAAERVHLLVDKDATRVRILDELIKLGRESEKGDVIIIYFAGHGKAPSSEQGSARYLMPVDGMADKPAATGIERSELERRLNEAEAVRQLLVLDCCFAGEGVRGDAVEDDPFAKLSGKGGNKNRIVITSTKGSETALDGVNPKFITPEDDPMIRDHSPFAYSLMRSLTQQPKQADVNENGWVEAEELYRSLRTEVIRIAQRHGHTMTPQMYPERPDDFGVIKVK